MLRQDFAMDHESRMEGVRRLLSPRIEQDDPNNADPVIKFPHLEREYVPI